MFRYIYLYKVRKSIIILTNQVSFWRLIKVINSSSFVSTEIKLNTVDSCCCHEEGLCCYCLGEIKSAIPLHRLRHSSTLFIKGTPRTVNWFQSYFSVPIFWSTPGRHCSICHLVQLILQRSYCYRAILYSFS